uniref:Uncharacterized protein n=1 Tax=Panagrolaimus superbus TaxID=310955 RepID=A0A914Z711_9BILA
MSDCRNDQSVTEFFKSKYFNDIEFIGYGVTYVSGCGGEKDGGKCLVEKITQLIDEHGSDDDVYWSANGL